MNDDEFDILNEASKIVGESQTPQEQLYDRIRFSQENLLKQHVSRLPPRGRRKLSNQQQMAMQYHWEQFLELLAFSHGMLLWQVRDVNVRCSFMRVQEAADE